MLAKTIISCPNLSCVKRLKVDSASVGKSARCHGCGTKFKLSLTVSSNGSELLLPTDAISPDRPPAEIRSRETLAIPLPEYIGRFCVKGTLGRGGFGIVYVAHDPELERDVAVKVPKPGTLTTELRLQRFLGDAKAAARLRHPHIVPVYDLGVHDGSWFIASAYIPGRTLASAISEKELNLPARIQIVRRLAEALDYAHAQGVIHRDVKPDNVMLDAADQPHLIDFGLAKLGDDRQGGGRAVMGTPMYMSPEQAAGRSHDADAKSDQYSLGVVLYELLSGQVPFTGPTSVILYQTVNNEPPPIGELAPSVPLDLILICNKALAKDPANRYASCGELADDLRRWMDGETPHVRVLTRRERLTRWVKKEPKLALAVSIALVAILSAAALGVSFGVVANRQAKNLALARDDAEASAREAKANAEKAEAKTLEAEANAKKADDNANKIQRTLAASHYDYAVSWCERGEIAQGMNWFVEAIRVAEASGATDLERAARLSLAQWRWNLNTLDSTTPVNFNPLVATVSPDRRFAVIAGSADQSGNIYRYDFTVGRDGGIHRSCTAPVHALCFDPNDSTIFVTGDERGNVQAWNAADCKPIGDPLVELGARVLSLAINTSGDLLAVGCADGTFRVYPRGTGTTRGLELVHKPLRPSGLAINALSFHPDPNEPLLLIGCGSAPNSFPVRGEAILLNTNNWEYLPPVVHKSAVQSVAFHPDGKSFVTGSGSINMGEGQAWSTKTRTPIPGAVFPHLGEVHSVAYSPDGRYLFTAGQDRAVRVWDADTHRAIGQPLWHGKEVRAVAGVGDRVIAVGDERAVRTWSVAPGGRSYDEHLFRDEPIVAASMLPGHVWVSTQTSLFPKLEHRLVGGSASRIYPDVAPGLVRSIAPNSKSVAVGGGLPDSDVGFVALYDYADKRIGNTLKITSAISAVGCSLDEELIAFGCDDGRVGILPTLGGKPEWLKNVHNARVTAVCFHPTKRWLLTCAKDNTAVIWDLKAGTRLQTFPLTGIGLSATFTPDGKEFLVGYAGGCMVKWDWESGSKHVQDGDLPHQAGILFVALAPGGETVLTGGTGQRVLWWDLKTRKQIGPGWPVTGTARSASFVDADTIFIAETDPRLSRYSFYKLAPAAQGTVNDLTSWIQQVTGLKLKVENGVSEVIAPGLVDAKPKRPQPVDQSIQAWRVNQQPRPAPVFPIPAVALARKPEVTPTPEVLDKPEAPPTPGVPAKPPLAEGLEGTFKVTAMSLGGEKAPEEFLKGIEGVTITADIIKIKMSNREEVATFKVDVKAMPASIDLTWDGDKKGIWKLEKGVLTIVINTVKGDKRPVNFDAKGANEMMFELTLVEKQKPAKPQKPEEPPKPEGSPKPIAPQKPPEPGGGNGGGIIVLWDLWNRAGNSLRK